LYIDKINNIHPELKYELRDDQRIRINTDTIKNNILNFPSNLTVLYIYICKIRQYVVFCLTVGRSNSISVLIHIYCHDLGGTIDGVWIGEWIY
jgi:hypothetical protein